MDSRRVDVLIEQADRQRRLANYQGAIELLQEALSLDPDHAVAHASLALALTHVQRLPAADVEARMALHLDGNDAFCHYAAAFVLVARRKLDEAWHHCLVAIESEQQDVDARVLGAHIRILRDERREARELIQEALELEPSHTGALTELARVEYRAGNYTDAAHRIEEALRSDPNDLEAHVLAGYIDLARGDADSAETHARFVLGQHAAERDGLELWAAIKARRSWLLGTWWRFSMWVGNRSEGGSVAMMIGGFLIARIAMIVAGALGYETLQAVLAYAWLGFCAYTWFAPVVFRRMLERDLGTVELDPNY